LEINKSESERILEEYEADLKEEEERDEIEKKRIEYQIKNHGNKEKKPILPS
jgi:hypothetical protein